jgi:hypothetical protein
MTEWRGRVEELLYDGETVRETLSFDEASVVVTSHRVLAFTPEADGANFRQVERPNVAGVSTGAQSRSGLLERGLRYGVAGAVLVVAGQVVDFGSILGGVDLGGQASREVGLGGILGPLQGMLNVLTQLDELMQMGGALALLLATALVGVYWFTREETLVVEVAGDEDVHVPRPADATAARDRLAAAVGPGGDLGEVDPSPENPRAES